RKPAHRYDVHLATTTVARQGTPKKTKSTTPRPRAQVKGQASALTINDRRVGDIRGRCVIFRSFRPILDLAGGSMWAVSKPVRARRLTQGKGRYLLWLVRRAVTTLCYRRALMIMASASGTGVPAIARLVAAHPDTARDVIHAFNARGLAVL